MHVSELVLRQDCGRSPAGKGLAVFSSIVFALPFSEAATTHRILTTAYPFIGGEVEWTGSAA